MTQAVGREEIERKEIEYRQALRARLIAQILRSIIGAPSPEKAAEYVVNLLTIHETELLAAAAATFASGRSVSGR